jgi:hypothetical protein
MATGPVFLAGGVGEFIGTTPCNPPQTTAPTHLSANRVPDPTAHPPL